jgi:hypothetical protein
LLMSVFHLAPWLKLISARRSGVHRSSPDSETVTEVGAVVRSITEKHTATKAKRASGA